MTRAILFAVGLAIATGADAQPDSYVMALQLGIGGAMILIALHRANKSV